MWRDISIPLSVATPEWPGDQRFTCRWTARREQGSNVNLSSVSSSLHTGTHADAPLHVHSNWPASELLDVGAFMGEATVLHWEAALHSDGCITAAWLEREIGRHAVSRLLLRTDCTLAGGAFPKDWPALDSAAANWLVDHQVVLWGVDTPSVDRKQSEELEIHHLLLGHGICIIENLDLRNIDAGNYELLAPPLAIEGADAAPLRALLRSNS